MRKNVPLSIAFPRWAVQWHVRNAKTAAETAGRSESSGWWIADGCGHEWEARVSSRVKSNSVCWVCSGKRVLAGFNDLLTTSPEIGREWHPTLNGTLLPSEVSSGSSKKVYWLGECGHHWQAVISSRTAKGYGCAVCSGRQLLTGFNDLLTCTPDAAAEWHTGKNLTMSPETTLNGSHAKVWWRCAHGHEWRATVVARTRPGTSTGRPAGCPYCSGRYPVVGENDLGTTHASLASHWHPSKNGDLTPTCVRSGSQKRVWWLGECGHEWKAKVAHRAHEGAGCPYCSGNKVLAGFNDIATTHRGMAEEWHPSKNTKSPTEVTRGHKGKVWWLCPVGHEYRASPNMRTNPSTESGCPDCYARAASDGTSETERLIADAVTSVFPDTVHGARVDRTLPGRSSWALDILVPSLKLVVEFDGQAWHCSCCSPWEVEAGSLEARDRAKTANLQELGYRVIRVRTPHLGPVTDEDLLIDQRTRPEAVAVAVLAHLEGLGIVPEPAVA